MRKEEWKMRKEGRRGRNADEEGRKVKEGKKVKEGR